MTPDQAIYVLDTNEFISAFKMFYRPTLCPNFGAVLYDLHMRGRIFSISQVKKELLTKENAIADWAKGMPSSFFASTRSSSLSGDFDSIVNAWDSQGIHTHRAINLFMDAAADGWLVAWAKAPGATLVTQETLDHKAVRKVKIPNACELVDVPCINMFSMLENLRVRFICQAETAENP